MRTSQEQMRTSIAVEVRERRERRLTVATAALLVAGCLPLTRVFTGLGFLAPVIAAALLALGVSWAARRLGAGPGTTLLATVAAWVLYVGLVFASDTLLLGVVPTPATLSAVRDLWLEGLTLVRTSPSPTYAEPPLLLLCVTGVWAVAHAVDGLVIRLAAPISAIVLTLVLWSVPLALAPQISTPWQWALPLLAASAGLLLASADAETGRFGRWIHPDDPGTVRAATNPLTTGGALLAVGAIVVGSVAAARLPGFGAQPWYELRGSGGTSLTTNPIVGIHTRLVADDLGPVLRVTSPRPLYLRTTSLDHYDGDREVWTVADTISGFEADGALFQQEQMGQAEQVAVSTEVVDLPGAEFVPLPYRTTGVVDSAGRQLRYDPVHAAFFVDEDETLQPGDRFDVIATVPTPTGEQLNAAPMVVDPTETALPEMPPEVGQLARDIVERAGARTWLEQAVAIQNELRSWEYSLEVVPTHRRAAIVAFLEERRGYCEQFAGTMALMLRELGIPARVAVGFTPGVPDRPDLVGTGQPVTYTVSLANSHAWVEVLFPGYGWIAFEPTPRSDGNVLVPTASNLAPAQTVTPPERVPEFAPGAAEQQPENDLLRRGAEAAQPTPAPVGTTPGAGAEPSTAMLLAALAVLVVVAFAIALLRARRDGDQAAPVDRVLRARDRVRRIGAGLGAPPSGAETDAEYLKRLLSFLPATATTGSQRRARARSAAEHLGRRAEQAQWAPALPDGAAEEAEQAAADLESVLLDDRPARRRLAVRARATLAGALTRPPRTPQAEQPRERELVS